VTAAELAVRIGVGAQWMRAVLDEMAAAGLATVDADGRWRLTSRGEVFGRAALEGLRHLGEVETDGYRGSRR
jgi:Mn-dependent DtxR family transcriptional regulator